LLKPIEIETPDQPESMMLKVLESLEAVLPKAAILEINVFSSKKTNEYENLTR